jgi:hypothetical protein
MKRNVPTPNNEHCSYVYQYMQRELMVKNVSSYILGYCTVKMQLQVLVHLLAKSAIYLDAIFRIILIWYV